MLIQIPPPAQYVQQYIAKPPPVIIVKPRNDPHYRDATDIPPGEQEMLKLQQRALTPNYCTPNPDGKTVTCK